MTTKTALEIDAPADQPVIHTTRFLQAPPELVFEAWTNPEHIRRWWGPRSLEIVVCEVDLRIGGRWHFVHRAPDGQEFGFHGEYREIDRPHRLVATWVYEGLPDEEALETISFEAVEGGTIARGTSHYPSVESRDGHLAAGMESGMVEAYERLDELFASLSR
jgi:uncharacterized protein YndB with AHSA1/START domain